MRRDLAIPEVDLSPETVVPSGLIWPSQQFVDGQLKARCAKASLWPQPCL